MMGIVWHGSYVKYLEDGREDFGNHYSGIGYMDIYRSGFKAPIVDLKIEYKKTLTAGEEITVETRYIPTEAAKIHFDYIVRNNRDEIIVTAYSIQVFLDKNDLLVLQTPEFYKDWKKKWKAI